MQCNWVDLVVSLALSKDQAGGSGRRYFAASS